MKHPFLALLTLLASLTFASEVLGQQRTYTTVDGEEVLANSVAVTWTGDDIFGRDATLGLNETLNDFWVTVSAPSPSSGVSRRVVDAEIQFTITGGTLTYTDEGTTTIITSGEQLTALSDDPNGTSSTGGVTFTSWEAPSEPGEYQIVSAVVGIDPNADPPPHSTEASILIITVTVTGDPGDPGDPEDPEDPEDPDRDARNSLNTDSAIQGIGAINNNIMHHLEQLRRNQRD